MMEALAATVVLILHGVDNREIRILPSQIASMQSRPPNNVKKEDRLYHESANCLVNTTDGKSLQVVEPCKAIQSMMEGSK